MELTSGSVATALTELMRTWRNAADDPKAFNLLQTRMTSTTRVINLDIDGQSFVIQVTEQ